MDLQEAMQTRHSVRSYDNRKIIGTIKEDLESIIEKCNQESGLHIQLCLNEPEGFSGNKAKYGNFKNVKNYIALVGKKGPGLEEACGYYGEKIVLKAQQLGLNTCWVALSFNKKKVIVDVLPDEKLLMVIALGYGTTQGSPHKTKSIEKLGKAKGEMPEWFTRALVATQLAPTAMNQQLFTFTLVDNEVSAAPGRGFYTKIDLGIAKYHFELGAEDADWSWATK